MERTRKNDYLKYWRVVRKYIKECYGLNQSDLDMLLFLYSEPHFTQEQFEEFNTVCPWEKGRFQRLKRDGWIVMFRKNNYYVKALYDLSMKGKRVCSTTYKLLNGDMAYSERPQEGDMFKSRTSTYSSRQHREIIKKINAKLKEGKTDIPEVIG